MEKECAICAKKSRMIAKLVKLRGKYNPTSKTRKYPNLQWTRVPVDVKHKNFKIFAGKRILACTKCIKTLSKTK